jgi:hypothetical protein
MFDFLAVKQFESMVAGHIKQAKKARKLALQMEAVVEEKEKQITELLGHSTFLHNTAQQAHRFAEKLESFAK